MFEVTWDELARCQIGTLNKGRGSNLKYRPFAFTELGVAMLSSVLNSDTAIKANRIIMRAFRGDTSIDIKPANQRSKGAAKGSPGIETIC